MTMFIRTEFKDISAIALFREPLKSMMYAGLRVKREDA